MDAEKENDEPGRKRHLRHNGSQLESKRSKITGAGPSGDVRPRVVSEVAGRIKSIELENFMCHAHIEVPFKTEANNCFYIGGPNGSGKSALFHALHLGLGGSGRENERGSSVSEYIKEGQTQAKIRITLTNKGDKAFRVAEYGDTVMVERTINKTSSTYCIKGWPLIGRERKERVVSRKKSELDVMLSFMDIQLDNPIFWMSQDRSRHFLSQMQPKKLFEIFATATELDKIEENYRTMHVYLDDIRTSEKSALERNQKLKRDIEHMRKKRDAIGRLNKRRADLLVYEWIAHQCPVRDALKKKKALENKLGEMKGARLLLKRRKDDMCQQKLDMDDEITAVYRKIEDFRHRLEQLDDVRKTLDLDLGKNSADLVSSKADLQRLEDESSHWKQQLKAVLGNLKQIQNSQGSDHVSVQIQEQKRRLADYSTQEVDLKRKFNEAKKNIPNINAQRQLLGNECSEIEKELAHLTAKIRESEKDIHFSQRIAVSDLNKFGEYTANILHLIEQNKDKFEQEPFGPIGRFIKVKEGKWAFAIEHCLKRVLYQYVFNSKKDEAIFYDILKRNRIPAPSTIISRFGLPPHDTRDNEPSSQFRTILRELSFSHPMARNILIDMCGIESILLLEGEENARTLMRQKCPENGSEAYTLEGTQIYGNSRHGQYRMYANTSRDKIARLLGGNRNVDVSACKNQLNQMESRVQHIRQTLRQTKQDYQERNNQFRVLEDSLSKIEKELNEIARQKRVAESKVIDLESKSENNDLDALQATYDELSQKIVDRESLISECHKRVQKLSKEDECLRKDLAEVKEDKKCVSNECKPEEDTFEGLEKKLGLINGELEGIDREMENFQKSDNEARDMISSADKELDQAQQQAAATANVLPVPEGYSNPPNYDNLPDKKYVEEEIRRIKRDIQDNECVAGGDAMISAEEISKRRQEFNEIRTSLKDFSKLAKSLLESIQYREDSLPLIKRAIAKRLHDKFEEIMRMRDFGANIDIKFDERMIDISVSVGQTNRAALDESDNECASPQKKKITKREKQDLKGLSGGERSYTTAAFVVALWEVMNAPFRCMDEFDVFMDMINRKIIMDLLVREATTTYSHCQFLFFTPQGIKELTSTDRVEIFEMQKPRD